MEYTFLIGATGLLGRYLLRDLLQAGARVAVLVRPTKKQSGRDRIEVILRQWEAESGKSLPRPVCLEGDVTKEGLGLDEHSLAWVAEHCGSMIHSAAVLTFMAESNGEPWNTNVEGTKHALAVCKDTGIKQLHYISTAYVCGLRDEVIRESDLDHGQEFRNDYERSKFQAETLVRAADFLDSCTIYRPAVISGDSKTGYTNTYHGLYLYLKLMSVLVWNTEPGPDGVRHTPVRVGMTGDEPRNIVPVDWVSAVICDLYQNEEAHGNTFHIAPQQPITPREIIEAGYRHFNSRGVEFSSADEARPISDMDRDAHENMTIYKLYEVSDPCFDTTNLNHFTPHLPCPQIDEPMLHRYWEYGEADRWGKRRVCATVYGDPIGDRLRDTVKQQRNRNRDDPETSLGVATDWCAGMVGLDVIGAAGGQWTVTVDAEDQLVLADGIHPDCSQVVTVPAVLLMTELTGQDDTESSVRLRELTKFLAADSPKEAVADLVALLLPVSAWSAQTEPGFASDGNGSQATGKLLEVAGRAEQHSSGTDA